MSAFSRKEDGRLVRGRGLFVDDESSQGLLHLKFVRSPYAHARIDRIDTSRAQSCRDTVCVFTGADVVKLTNPFGQMAPAPASRIRDYCLAVDRVRFQGEPVAAVVATSAAAAEDAAELVRVDFTSLDVVLDAVESLQDGVILHPEAGTNRTWQSRFEWGEVESAFREAAYTIRIDRLHFHRFSSTPLETYAAICRWGADRVEFFCNMIQPGVALKFIAPALKCSPERLRVRTHDIGGGFGIKQNLYPYLVAGALASRMVGGRPVKWIETRTEHLQASSHGNERTFLDTEVALDKEGEILAIRSRHVDDCGAYPRYEPLGCVIWSQVAPGPYKLRNLRIDFEQAVTNKCPVGPNRGFSRMQHLWFLERVIDICARQLAIPADVMRRRNYIDHMPYETPNGCIYDSGDYPRMLEVAQELIGWQAWYVKIAALRAEGKCVGIGIGTAMDSGTNNFGQSRIINPNSPLTGNSEAANIRVGADGLLIVTVGTVPQGQSHETVAAQVIAAELGVPEATVLVQTGFDTDRGCHTGHSGTYASQFAVTGLGALHGATEKLREELLRLASYALCIPQGELAVGARDAAGVVATRDGVKSITLAELAGIVNLRSAGLPAAVADITLNCRYVYRAPFEVPDRARKFGNLTLTYASQIHIAVVEIDRGTYNLRILDYVAVDECGRVINHDIVRGQVLGGTAHGIGAALLERFEYDTDGNLLTTTFSDYCPITILNMPDVRYGNLECPSPFTYNGAKGMGEGGGTPLSTLAAAMQDALAASGYVVDDSHHTPSTLFAVLNGRRRGAVVELERRNEPTLARSLTGYET